MEGGSMAMEGGVAWPWKWGVAWPWKGGVAWPWKGGSMAMEGGVAWPWKGGSMTALDLRAPSPLRHLLVLQVPLFWVSVESTRVVAVQPNYPGGFQDMLVPVEDGEATICLLRQPSVPYPTLINSIEILQANESASPPRAHRRARGAVQLLPRGHREHAALWGGAQRQRPRRGAPPVGADVATIPGLNRR